jgi:hypothetical protein
MGLQRCDAVREPTVEAGWRLSLYPTAGECGGSFRFSWDGPRGPVAAGGGDPERSRAEAARRARSKLRRYCAASRLNRFGTLTYAGDGCHEPSEVRQHAGLFFRDLRARLGGEPFPYVWVPEWHKSGHGLHLHFAVGQFIPRGKIAAAWGRGFVHIKLLGDLPVGSGSFGEARAAARYLSKYVGKSFEQERVPGLHRYEVAQGFMPEPVLVKGRSETAALDAACEVMGGFPARVWRSSDQLDWQGPPAVWAQWAA